MLYGKNKDPQDIEKSDFLKYSAGLDLGGKIPVTLSPVFYGFVKGSF